LQNANSPSDLINISYILPSWPARRATISFGCCKNRLHHETETRTNDGALANRIGFLFNFNVFVDDTRMYTSRLSRVDTRTNRPNGSRNTLLIASGIGTSILNCKIFILK
jgi:hypothetical protein